MPQITVPVAEGAVLDASFLAGKQGRYDIAVRIVGVNMENATKPLLHPETWTNAFRQSGVPARAVKVKYVGNANPRHKNPFDIFEIFGVQNLVDMDFVLTIDLYEDGKSAGMGAINFVAVGVVVLCLIAVAAVFEVVANATGGENLLVTGAKRTGQAIGGLVGGVVPPILDAAGKAAWGVTIPIVITLGLFLLMAGKSKIRTPWGGAG